MIHAKKHEMNRHKIKGGTRPSGDSPDADSLDPVGGREHLLDALRECYGIANDEAEHRIREFEARNDRASESGADSVAALLRGTVR